jgi:hypothetical protein
MEFSGLLEVAGETGPQILGLAHVEDSASGVHEPIDARRLRDITGSGLPGVPWCHG